ncbi:MAG TPA: hypothetical protein VHN99_01630, partial [Deinococcales bacterium]|nr:hypothetical protein [Deinococcales bacterium]
FGLFETLAGLSFLYGGFTRLFAAVLAVVWLAAWPVAGPLVALENLPLLGWAGFFWLAGRGPLALDRLLFPRLEPTSEQMRRAPPVLRVATGLGIMILALTQNLANGAGVLAVLRDHPFNLLAGAGLGVPDATFALIVGGVQFTAGLLIALGVFSREVALVALIPASLFVSLGLGQLPAALPLLAALAFLLIWEGGANDEALWLDGLRHGPLAINRPPPLLRGERVERPR